MLRRKKMILMVLIIVTITIVCVPLFNKNTVYDNSLKIMTTQDYKMFSPYNPIDSKQYQNSLFYRDKKYEKKYFEIQALYRKGVEEILNNDLNLTGLDSKVNKMANNLGFVEGKQDIYKKYSTLDFTYFYLRNYIHVERLSNEQLKFLYNKIITNDFEVDETLCLLIKDTYFNVLSYGGEGDLYKVTLSETSNGSTPPYAKVDSDSIVIMISLNVIDTDKFSKEKDKLKEFHASLEFENEMKVEVLLIINGISL